MRPLAAALRNLRQRARPAHEPVPSQRLRTQGLLRRRKATRPNGRPPYAGETPPATPYPRGPRPLRDPQPPARPGILGYGLGVRSPRSVRFGPRKGSVRRVGPFPPPLPGPRWCGGLGAPAFPRLSLLASVAAQWGRAQHSPAHLALWALPVWTDAHLGGVLEPLDFPPLWSLSFPTETSLGAVPASPDASGFWPLPAQWERGSQLLLPTPPLAAASHKSGRGMGRGREVVSGPLGSPHPLLLPTLTAGQRRGGLSAPSGFSPTAPSGFLPPTTG